MTAIQIISIATSTTAILISLYVFRLSGQVLKRSKQIEHEAFEVNRAWDDAWALDKMRDDLKPVESTTPRRHPQGGDPPS